MTRTAALVGSVVMLIVGPGTVVGLAPWLITRWQVRPPLLGLAALPLLGGALAATGVVVLLDSFVRFVLRGRGTPAPVLPPTHLVVTGLYCHVRNPMYVAILGLVLGQGFLFGHPALLAYTVALWAAFHTFVVAYEEPRLRRTFGEEYDRFRANVPRWIPRLRGWRGDGR